MGIHQQLANNVPRTVSHFGTVPPMNALVAVMAVALFQVISAIAFGGFAVSVDIQGWSLGQEQRLMSPAYGIGALVVLVAFARNVPRPAATLFGINVRIMVLSTLGIALFLAILSGLSLLAIPVSGTQRGLSSVLRPVAGGAPGEVIVLMIALPALTEELVLRLVVQPGLTARYSAPAAVIITAALYALGYGSLGRIVVGFIMAVIAGVLLHSARSIWPALAVHLAANGLAVLALSPEVESVFRDYALAILVLTSGIAGICIAGLRRYARSVRST
ncbi:MAG: CPBP family intramembrane glutamic endopeptidase [Spirochaetaceae bacterium]